MHLNSFVIFGVSLTLLFCVGTITATCTSPETWDFNITTTWDDQPVKEDEIVTISFSCPPNSNMDGLVVDVTAPWYNDSLPTTGPGVTEGLWEFEVVELEFLASKVERYLEVEMGPGGHYLVLNLAGKRNVVNSSWTLDYKATMNMTTRRWTGHAFIPSKYFPDGADKFNAFASHGDQKNRTFMALFPVPFNSTDSPDFYNFSRYEDLDFSNFLQTQANEDNSSKTITISPAATIAISYFLVTVVTLLIPFFS